MKHYVLGFIFNKTEDRVLLVKKKRPKWQAGHWNGVGGKIEEDDDNPLSAMDREAFEETDLDFAFEHCLTFVCPGGTVFVFKGIYGGESITFNQKEDEQLKVWDISDLPKNTLNSLYWMIPLLLSDIVMPILLQRYQMSK